VANRREHPVVWGVVALVVVSTFLGLLLGLGTLAGSRMVGLGADGGDGTPGGGESLYLPSPEQTSSTSSPSPSEQESTKSGKKNDKKNKNSPAITLTAGQQSVSPMEQIDLTGRYPGGDGAVLQVQRLDGGRWVPFPVTTSVSDGGFSTFIQTGRPGPNKFRMADPSSGNVSNRVTVTIG
jgi:hypothetical protein